MSEQPTRHSFVDHQIQAGLVKQLDSNTELARAVDVHVMIARAKRIYILMIKMNDFFSFVAVFSKRNRKHALRVSIELKGLVFPQHFSFSQTSTCVSHKLPLVCL